MKNEVNRQEKIINVVSDDYGRIKIPKSVKDRLNITDKKFTLDFILGDKYIFLKEHDEDLFKACETLIDTFDIFSKISELGIFSEETILKATDLLSQMNLEIDKTLVLSDIDSRKDMLSALCSLKNEEEGDE